MRRKFEKIAPQIGFLDAIRAELGDDGVFVDEVTQLGFAARIAYPVYKPRTFISPGYQDGLGWGYATALGVQDARRDVPVLSISGDGGFLFTAHSARLPRLQRWSVRQRTTHAGGGLRRPPDSIRSHQSGFCAVCQEFRGGGGACARSDATAPGAPTRLQAT
jgi:hypothetical protein